MPTGLGAALGNPPAGVQVWSACAGGKYSYEFDDGHKHGGVFMEQLLDVLGPTGGRFPCHRARRRPTRRVPGRGRDPKARQGRELASREKLRTRETKALAAEASALLEDLGKNYPGTPWAVLARRDLATRLGLGWQPCRMGRP